MAKLGDKMEVTVKCNISVTSSLWDMIKFRIGGKELRDATIKAMEKTTSEDVKSGM